MKAISVIAILASCTHLAYLQQCKQMMVCDDDFPNSGRRRGQKGDVGAPGKAGPIGMKGSKGDAGAKGIKGEACDLESIESKIQNQLATQEMKLQNLTKALNDLSTLVQASHHRKENESVNPKDETGKHSNISIPCNALNNGTQTLQSGLKVVCRKGWVVFQNNKQNEGIFGKNWLEYKNGFGDFNGDFWLGLENIYKLTKQRGCKLQVEVWDLRNSKQYAEYKNFYLGNESQRYTLHVSGYNGTAGDGLVKGTSFRMHNNMPFTTIDRDNDNNDENCAKYYENAGWWYNNCYESNLNRRLGSLYWNQVPRKSSTMMLRCN